MLKNLLHACAAACLALFAAGAFAEYPEKPVKIILPYAPGGAGDMLIRSVQGGLEKQLGQSVIIDYRTGAAGNIGAREVVNAAPDGYTLLLGPTNNFVINQHLFANLGYDPLQALAPVTLLADTPYLVFINSTVPAASFAQFASYARANPGKLNYGSPGNATVPHLSAFMLSETLGAHMTHIPYRGAQPGVQALLANDVQMFIISYSITGPLVASGRLRALAVAAPQRLKALPEVPTTAEVGLAPDVLLGNWWGIAAPKGTDPAILRRLSQSIRVVLGDADVQRRYNDQGAVAGGVSPAEFSERMAREAAAWKSIVEKSGAKVDN
jgi:tripartite-type tricarboxylate transporter receptor subunit TctC